MNDRKRDLGRARLFGRIGSLGTAGAVSAVALIMMLTPVASATTITKPYYHLGVGTSFNVQQSGCSHAKQNHLPVFGKKVGVFKTAGQAKSPFCAGSALGNNAYWGASVNLISNLHFTTNGSAMISANWKIALTENWTLVPYTTCALNYNVSFSTCAAYAEVSIFTYLFVTDMSNSSWGTYGYGFAIGGFVDIYNYSSVQNYSQNYCFAGTCTHYGGNFSSGTPTGSFSGFILGNSTLNLTGTSSVLTTDKYQVQIYFSVGTFTGAYVQNAKSTGKANAAAAVDMASGARGAALTSIFYG